MLFSNLHSRRGHICLKLMIEPFEDLRYIGVERDLRSSRWTAKFCASTPLGCTLHSSEFDQYLVVINCQIDMYRAACHEDCPAKIEAPLHALFWSIFFLIKRCVDLGEKDCICPMEWRVHRAEALGPILIDIAWALWANGADMEPVAEAIKELACLTTEVHEQQQEVNETYPPFAKDCPSLAARADRLAVKFFDAENDLFCNNWPPAGW